MQVIGLLGGTGDLGRGLSVHLVNTFEKVMVGSRSKEKALATVQAIAADKSDRNELFKRRLVAVDNSEVASTAEIIIVTLPFEVAVDTVKQLRGSFRGNQLVISAAASLEKRGHEFRSTRGSSVTQQIRAILPENIEVAAAFQTVPALVLYNSLAVEADVFVASDKKTTYDACSQVIRSIKNLRPLFVGSLEIAPEIEGLTSILLNVAIKNRLKNPAFKVLSETNVSPV